MDRVQSNRQETSIGVTMTTTGMSYISSVQSNPNGPNPLNILGPMHALH
jgi:hypothetical protein